MKHIIQSFTGAAVAAFALIVVPAGRAAITEYNEPPFFSGQTSSAGGTTEPAVDDVTGKTVFLLTPNGAPFPSNANPAAQDTLYLPAYPLSSTIPPSHLDCQTGAVGGVGNCTHLQVLPFADAAYGSLPGSSPACVKFNGGNPCTPYLGHDHLVGVPSTGGAFNVAWHVKLVLFTAKAFDDGAINTRIATLDQIDALVASGDVVEAPTPVIFNCQVVPEAIFARGAPVTFAFP